MDRIVRRRPVPRQIAKAEAREKVGKRVDRAAKELCISSPATGLAKRKCATLPSASLIWASGLLDLRLLVRTDSQTPSLARIWAVFPPLNCTQLCRNR